MIMIGAALLTFCSLTRAEPATQPADTLWVIPHTHWEGAVFKTREEYLQIGFSHITHALQLLQKYPKYTFVFDQVAYVRPYIERFPEQAGLFHKFVDEGRLQLVLGMDVMPDDSKPGGETFIRQIQYGKGYYRKEFGKDVTIAWMLDTFGHHGQIPQLFKLGGYTSFWFFRGVPRQDFPSEFMWEGIDGTQIPAFWEPFGYGDFYGSPRTVEKFEKYARDRFNGLNANAKGHDRVVYSGADVTDPEDSLPAMMQQADAKRLGFNIRFGVPTEFESAVLKRSDLPVFKGDLNPIFQGTYSSRIELKQWMRTDQRILTTAEKLAAIDQLLGVTSNPDPLWEAWEPVLFDETHDLASGVMTDHVYDDTIRNYQFAESAGNHLIDRAWNHIAGAIDTRGDGDAFVVFNTLSWARTDVAELTLAFTEDDVHGVRIVDDTGKEVPAQIVSAERARNGSIREAHVALLARDIPSMGYRVFHVTPLMDGNAPASSAVEGDAVQMANDALNVAVDGHTGAITSLKLKDGNWEALSAPANVIFRQEDHGDVWEPYHGLDGGSRIAMTATQPRPKRGTDVFSDEERAKPGTIVKGPVFSEFTVAHPFGGGKFATTIRLVNGSSRVEITTKLVNESKYVRYQATFPTSIASGHQTQSIPFGAMTRPEGIEFPAQDWTDWADDSHGVSILNVGLPGNLTANGTMFVSLLRSHTLGAYGFGGGYEPGMSSDGGLELGVERTLRYAIEPHAGSWRDAHVWQAGVGLGDPLICRKTMPHDGALPKQWSFAGVSNQNVVISSISPGKDGATIVRVYEAAGQKAERVSLRMASPIRSATEVNLMEDRLADAAVEGSVVHFDLRPFEIKTFSLQLRAPSR